MDLRSGRRSPGWAVAHAVVALLLVGCGGGSDGGNPPPGTADLAGTWAFVITRGPNTCGDPVGVSQEHVGTITQTEDRITVQMPLGRFEGTVVGSQGTVRGTFVEDGGWTTFVAWTLIESTTGLTGTAQWTWGLSPTGVPAQCDGTSDIAGTRVPQPTPQPPPTQVPDFLLSDVNPNSATYGTDVSPRQHLARVSAWYFGAAT